MHIASTVPNRMNSFLFCPLSRVIACHRYGYGFKTLRCTTVKRFHYHKVPDSSGRTLLTLNQMKVAMELVVFLELLGRLRLF